MKNYIFLLGQCDQPIQDKMLWHFAQCDRELATRVAEGLGVAVPEELLSAAR